MQAHLSKTRLPGRSLSGLALLVLFMLNACTQNEGVICLPGSGKDNPAITSINGTWKVIAYEDLASNTAILKDSANSWGGLDVVLTFEGNRISGQNTTNQVSGRFSYKGTRGISVEEYGGTEIGEPQWGRMFGDAVFKFQTFTINERHLTFYYNNGNNLVRLEKQ
jgi:hypothetical protein